MECLSTGHQSHLLSLEPISCLTWTWLRRQEGSVNQDLGGDLSFPGWWSFSSCCPSQPQEFSPAPQATVFVAHPHGREKFLFLRSCCSVTQLCLTLCDPMDRSTPDFPVLHHLPNFEQTHVHSVSDAIQPSNPLSYPSPPALNLSKHQGLCQ